MIYKFVSHKIPSLDALKSSYIFKLHEKVSVKGLPLSREEKDDLFSQLYLSSYGGKTGVPLLGWMFTFEDVLKRFLVRLKYYGWTEYYAPDKTSIRSFFKSKVLEIISAPQK